MNQREIAFSNLEIARTRVELDVSYEEHLRIWFDFDRAIPISASQVALAMSTLCGRVFSEISFDFEVEASALDAIRRSTGANVTALVIEDSPLPMLEGGNLLSFSGGFDSFSAWRLMPDDTKLVSLDFGGWFEREAEFFRDFDSLIVKTNMRSVPSQMTSLARNHWSFMAVGAILTARFFNVRFHSFGSILGESLSRQAGNAPKLEVLDVLGFEDAGYARGLTEVGTASIILQSDPGRAADSLKSLSGPRDKKIFRKTAISRILNDKLGGGLQLQANNFSRSPKIKYGDDYASSLAALYCLAQGRGNEIEELFEGIPDNAKELAGRLNMEFMEKVNWDAYASFPEDLKPGLWQKLARFGMEPYSESDWDVLRVVRDHLSEAYKVARAV